MRAAKAWCLCDIHEWLYGGVWAMEKGLKQWGKGRWMETVDILRKVVRLNSWRKSVLAPSLHITISAENLEVPYDISIFFVVFLVCFWGFVCFEIPRQEPNQSKGPYRSKFLLLLDMLFTKGSLNSGRHSEDWLQAPPYRQIDSFNQQQHSEYRGKNGGLSAWLKWMQKPWVECLGYQVTWEVVWWWEKLFEGREIWVQF